MFFVCTALLLLQPLYLLTVNHFYHCSGPIKHRVNVRPIPMPKALLLCLNVYEVVRSHLCTCAVCMCPVSSRSPFTGTRTRRAAYLVSHTVVMRLCSRLIMLGRVFLLKEPSGAYRNSYRWHRNCLRYGDGRLPAGETMN